MPKLHHLAWLYTGVILCAVVISSQKLDAHKDIHAPHHRGALTIPTALERFSNYMGYLIRTYHVPHSKQKQQEDMHTTQTELVTHATTDEHGDMYIERIILERLEKAYKKKLSLLYPGHFESKVIKDGFYSIKLAKERIKAEILNSMTLGSSPEEIRAAWKNIKHNFVNPQLSKKTLIEYYGTHGLPVITEQSLIQLIAHTKNYIEKQYKKDHKRHGKQKTKRNKNKKHHTKNRV